MIEELSLRGFKPWQDSGPLRLGRLTGLFGTNGSGNTSVLQLVLLKQAADSPDRELALDLGDGRGLVELGTFLDLRRCAQAPRRRCGSAVPGSGAPRRCRELADPHRTHEEPTGSTGASASRGLKPRMSTV
ncbi:hypothetical protein [Azohydromonas sediminis]|uniref:hypothetical protein n=1 Tax=Azohydromonas sediminis TaxID=2259674 RepID=UPI000E65A07F|nr:hypothetical protein [Azohydromonas sediminis]